MLRGIHKASANWLGRAVMGVILGLIAISFGIWGIGDIFKGFGQSTLAKVGSTEIRIDTFRTMYQERLQQLGRQIGRPILPDQARALGLDRQLLGQVISETLLDERARALKLGLSDAEVARRVTDDPNFKGITGQFDRARFEALIRSIGMNETRYLAEQRRVWLRQQLISTVGGELAPPKTALEAFNRYQNETRNIEYILLGSAQAGDIPDPAPEVLAKYFEERKILFRTPEVRKATLLVLTPTELAATVEISDADLKQAYEARKARFGTPERRHVQQIVFPNAEEARDASEKIAKGMTFAALAAERSLKDSDFDLGTLAQSAMVDRAIGDAAFSMKEGETSKPVEGRFGIALVHVVKIEPAQTQPFEQVAEQLKREVALDRAKNEVQTMHDKVEDERLSGVPITEAAKKFNLKTRTVEVDRTGRMADGGQISDLPQGVDVLASVFTAEVGGDNDPLTIPQSGGYVWFDVAEIKPARDRPLDEVKDQVLTRWRNDEVASRLKTKATEMVDKLKGGASMAEVAASVNSRADWLPGLKRSSTPPNIPARAMADIFNTPKDGVGQADGATAADRIVFKVNEITVPEFNAESAEAKRVDEALRKAIGDDVVTQYLAKLEKDIGVTINQAGLNQVSGGSTNN
jgi:peptidyl-prolyl cis-trans isomerase D